MPDSPRPQSPRAPRFTASTLHRGNRLLKRALFQAAFAAIGCKADPSSRIYYDRQRARGKTHTQAVLRLARQRVNVIHAVIRNGTLYEPRTPDLAA